MTSGSPAPILSARLDRLVEEGVFVRRPYSDRPPRSEYLLTEKSRDLFPVLVTPMQWGDRWTSDDGPPLHLVHEPCEHVTPPAWPASTAAATWPPTRSGPSRPEPRGETRLVRGVALQRPPSFS